MRLPVAANVELLNARLARTSARRSYRTSPRG
jgi:hypothetical protein